MGHLCAFFVRLVWLARSDGLRRMELIPGLQFNWYKNRKVLAKVWSTQIYSQPKGL